MKKMYALALVLMTAAALATGCQKEEKAAAAPADQAAPMTQSAPVVEAPAAPAGEQAAAPAGDQAVQVAQAITGDQAAPAAPATETK